MGSLAEIASGYRPIQYLGNKSRLTSEIVKIVKAKKSGSGDVLDLFSGSGIVSNAFSGLWDTVACDIQFYAKVLAEALICDFPDMMSPEGVIDMQKYDDSLRVMIDTYEPILKYEERAVKEAGEGNPAQLFEIIERGHLLDAYAKYDMGQDSRLAQAKKECKARQVDCLPPKSNLIVQYFGGIFFSYYQAVQLDAFWNALPTDKGGRTLGIAALLSTASAIANTVGGQFAQPLNVRTSTGEWKSSLVSKVIRDRNKDVEGIIEESVNNLLAWRNPRADSRAVQGECSAFLKACEDDVFSAIYADPPYSRYHYSRYYHVLETIALHDWPEISINPATKEMSKGIYRKRRFQSPFSTRKGAATAFIDLLKLCSQKSPTLILSYSPYPEKVASTPRMVKIEELFEWSKKYYKDVEICVPSSITHARLNKSDRSLERAKNMEVILICER